MALVKANMMSRITLAVLCAVLSACSVDLLGFFGSSDLDRRLESADSFIFLTDTDRNLTLPAEYSFIVLSDTHIEDGDAHGLGRLSSIIRSETLDSAGDKFVVVTGDITQNGKAADIQKFIDIAHTLDIPVYPVLGNHDIYHGNWKVWRDKIGSSRYRINGTNTTLFILDTANAFFGAPQLNWLEHGLSQVSASSHHSFVFTHTNLFVRNVSDSQAFTDIRERSRIVALLKGRCDAMFSGHLHRRVLYELGDVQYITIEDYIGNKTYCRVFVSPTGIRYEFHTL